MKVLIKEKISPHKSKTPEGYLICRDAILGRTGSQEYHKNEIFAGYDGEDEVVNVVRDSKEVFSPEAIASFENKPVTCEHPDEDVTPDNYKDYAVGFVRDVHQGKVDGEDVLLGNLIITDADIINDIENGIRTELSCGYTCDITDEAQPRQVNIRGNHVALCEQGRAGIAKIVDSVPGNPEYVKGLIFQSDKDIPAKSNFDFDEGLYRVGSHTFILVFHSGTHASKEQEVVKKYSAKNFESFSTSLVNGKVDTRDFRQLKRYEPLAAKLIVRATGYFGSNKITDELVKGKSKEAFEKNVKTEIAAGKSPKQAVAIAYSVKERDDEPYDTYRGYDIDQADGEFEVVFDGTVARFARYEQALKYIDDCLEKTEALLRDRAIRDREYSPYFKREIRKELAHKESEVENEEAPDDPTVRMNFRKTKNSLLKKLKGFIEEARDE